MTVATTRQHLPHTHIMVKNSHANEVHNMRLHGAHIYAIAAGSPAQRNAILRAATPQLVRALSTVLRILQENGVKFSKTHERRARRLISKNTAMRTKMGLVAGKGMAQSRGGLFFKHAASTMLERHPQLVMHGDGFFGNVGKWFNKAGKTIGSAAKDAGKWIKGAAEKAAPVLEEGAKKVGEFAVEHLPEILEAAAA